MITSGGTASFAENRPAGDIIYQGTMRNAGGSQSSFIWSLSGADAARFAIDMASGAVRFNTSPNFEAPADAGGNNIYDITVTASDGALRSASQAVAITVTNVNEAPLISSAATASFAENGTGTAYQATGSDPDGGITLNWTLGGADAALFNIGATTGAVRFNTSPNFEAPGDMGGNNVYDITVTATDGLLRSTARAVAITVTNVNEAPLISSAATASFAENGTGTAYQATGSDPDAGTTLSWTLGGADAALFNISATTGAVRFNTSPSFEAPGDVGGNNVYDITVTASDGLLGSTANAVTISVTDVAGVTQNGAAEPVVLIVVTENAWLSSAGNDAFVVSDSLDLIIETTGAGVVTMITTVSMSMPDHVGVLQIAPGISGITITGGTGNDVLISNGLSNTLNGGAGDDVILTGNVTLTDIYALFAI